MPKGADGLGVGGGALLLDDHRLHGLRRAFLTKARTDRDLSLRQLAILFLLTDPAGPRTVRHVAAFLGVSKPVVSRSMDVLGEMGLAERARDPADRRSVLLSATPLGLALVESFVAESRETAGRQAETTSSA